MNLHKNIQEFYDTLLVLGDRLNTSPAIIEKDWWFTTSYETSITALYKIIESGVFEK